LILDELNSGGKADYFVWMVEESDLSAASGMETKLEKGTYVYDTLRATAARTRRGCGPYLDSQGASYRAFYIVNAVLGAQRQC